MKVLYQFGVILAVAFVGEILHFLIPLPIPASIYGLVLMLICLCTKIIRLEQVKQAADFLIEIMPTMFIPAAVGLIAIWKEVERIIVPVVVISSVTTIIVMVCTGRASQAVIRKKKRREK